jgi:hypothetical protein
VWGPEYVDDNQLLRVYVTYLRQTIEPDPSNPRYIFNEREWVIVSWIFGADAGLGAGGYPCLATARVVE